MILHWAVAPGFILLSVLIRLLPYPWHFTPIVGMGLFAGAHLPQRWAIATPVLAMAAGDLLLGWLPVHLFGWIAVAGSGCLGFLLRRKRSPLRMAAASVASSTLFYLLSNFGVWLLGCVPGWYPATPQGLAACMAAGIPFYRNGLLGDLLYTGLLFGSYELFLRWITRRSPAAAGAFK
ncbi:MAG: hypothetical protein HYZ90_02760 [Candidatus Omnitrophica bacterium]|nr:hypothetical protein [Candidatus Omnitrophota bacterium]